MDKREKQLKKRIEGLERQKEKHKLKLKTLSGRKDTTMIQKTKLFSVSQKPNKLTRFL